MRGKAGREGRRGQHDVQQMSGTDHLDEARARTPSPLAALLAVLMALARLRCQPLRVPVAIELPLKPSWAALTQLRRPRPAAFVLSVLVHPEALHIHTI